ncbi:MAG: maiA, partial [Phenylobacterium sp.]|nr:maiA [Phenylobacterium sp.]
MAYTLYSAWRATAPYRVRIGLALKGVAYDYVGLDLIKGDQREPAYRAVNPQGLTPALDIGGHVLTQSLAILEWLEETRPEPAILPTDPLGRATVRAMAGIIACDIHPLNNTRVGRELHKRGVDPAGILAW